MISSRRSKVSAALVLVAALTLAVRLPDAAPGAGGPYSDKEFATPEAAIEHLIESIAKGNESGVFESFSISKWAEKFDFGASVERMGVLELQQTMLPPTSALYRSMNEATRASFCAYQVRGLVLSLVSNQAEAFRNATVVRAADASIATAFAASIDPKKLVSLKVDKVVAIPPKTSSIYARNLKNEAAQGKITRADEQQEFLVLYNIGGQTFTGGFTAHRYGTKWSIASLSAPLSGLPANGSVEKSSVAAFLEASVKFGA
jgi:hypothetical protein